MWVGRGRERRWWGRGRGRRGEEEEEIGMTPPPFIKNPLYCH